MAVKANGRQGPSMRKTTAGQQRQSDVKENGAVAKGNEDGQVSSEGEEQEQEQEQEQESEDDVMEKTRLDISKHPLPPIDGLINALSQFHNLQRLDMSAMQPAQDNHRQLDSLAWLGRAVRKGKARRSAQKSHSFGDRLTWLKYSDNPMLGETAGNNAWDGLEQLVNLTVINASSCAIQCAPPTSTLVSWTSLGALILGHNSIKNLNHFPAMPQLNTLVLSHNQLAKLPSDLAASLPGLKKLSITHNDLQWHGKDDKESPLPDFSLCSHLREVRLSGNASLKRLPLHLATWGKGVGNERKGTGLEILEAGECALIDFDAIAAIVQKPASNEQQHRTDSMHPSRRRIRGLTTLLLKGNDVVKAAGYRDRVLQSHPGLRVLDNERLVEKVKSVQESEEKTKDADKLDNVPSLKSKPKPKQEHTSTVAKGPLQRASRNPDAWHANEGVQKDKPSTSRAKVLPEKVERARPKASAKGTEKREPEASEPVVERKVVRKRGSRGSSKAKGKQTEEEGGQVTTAATGKDDPFLSKVVVEKKKDKDKNEKVGKRADGKSNAKEKKAKERRDDEGLDLARIRARAGDVPSTPARAADSKQAKAAEGKEKKLAKDHSASPSSLNKKRKAWDGSETKDDEVSTTSKKHKFEPSNPENLSRKEDEKRGKEVTSIEGVINVAKKKGQALKQMPSQKSSGAAWSDRKDVWLGQGGAWD